MIYSDDVSQIIDQQESLLQPYMQSAALHDTFRLQQLAYLQAQQSGIISSISAPMTLGGGIFGPSTNMPFIYGYNFPNAVLAAYQQGSLSTGVLQAGLSVGFGTIGALTTLAGFGVFGHKLTNLDPIIFGLNRFGAAASRVMTRGGLTAKPVLGIKTLGLMGAAIKAGEFGLLGRAMLAGALRLVPILGTAALIGGAVHKMADWMVEGAREQGEINTLMTALAVRENLPYLRGYRFGLPEMREVGRTISEMYLEQGNLWLTKQDIASVLRSGLEQGLFKEIVKRPEDLTTALRELTSALKDTARVYNTTVIEATRHLQTYRELGFREFRQAVETAQYTRGLEVAGGFRAGGLLPAGQLGAQLALGVGQPADMIRRSVRRAMELGSQIGYINLQGMRAGLLSEDVLLEQTGLTGEQARISFLQNTFQQAHMLAYSRFGRLASMAFTNPQTGTAIPGANIGLLPDLIADARLAMRTREGRIQWMLNREKITQEAITEMGPDVYVGNILNMLVQRVGSRFDEFTTDLLIQRLTGIAPRESRLYRRLAVVRPLQEPRLLMEAQTERDLAAAQAYITENTGLTAAWKLFQRAIGYTATKEWFYELGADISYKINNYMREQLSALSGIHRVSIPEDIRRDLQNFWVGGKISVKWPVGANVVPSALTELEAYERIYGILTSGIKGTVYTSLFQLYPARFLAGEIGLLDKAKTDTAPFISVFSALGDLGQLPLQLRTSDELLPAIQRLKKDILAEQGEPSFLARTWGTIKSLIPFYQKLEAISLREPLGIRLQKDIQEIPTSLRAFSTAQFLAQEYNKVKSKLNPEASLLYARYRLKEEAAKYPGVYIANLNERAAEALLASSALMRSPEDYARHLATNELFITEAGINELPGEKRETLIRESMEYIRKNELPKVEIPDREQYIKVINALKERGVTSEYLEVAAQFAGAAFQAVQARSMHVAWQEILRATEFPSPEAPKEVKQRWKMQTSLRYILGPKFEEVTSSYTNYLNVVMGADLSNSAKSVSAAYTNLQQTLSNLDTATLLAAADILKQDPRTAMFAGMARTIGYMRALTIDPRTKQIRTDRAAREALLPLIFGDALTEVERMAAILPSKARKHTIQKYLEQIAPNVIDQMELPEETAASLKAIIPNVIEYSLGKGKLTPQAIDTITKVLLTRNTPPVPRQVITKEGGILDVSAAVNNVKSSLDNLSKALADAGKQLEGTLKQLPGVTESTTPPQ